MQLVNSQTLFYFLLRMTDMLFHAAGLLLLLGNWYLFHKLLLVSISRDSFAGVEHNNVSIVYLYTCPFPAFSLGKRSAESFYRFWLTRWQICLMQIQKYSSFYLVENLATLHACFGNVLLILRTNKDDYFTVSVFFFLTDFTCAVLLVGTLRP